MLITVREDQLKIAMGFLSYLPEYKDISAAQREIDWYQNDANRQLLLWQDTASRHYIAFLGLEYLYDAIVVHQLIFSVEVTPKERLDLRQAILDALSVQYPKKTIMGTVKTQHIINDWREAGHIE
ncbi:riboflavin biosynthesis RibT protein [Weissella uvarum]|uniref:reductase n=1 Tax=Weissella uvarum TaxID=1479233 RepID=UPI0019620806|nr:reductase [Weissella uvarum]MBM7617076.1 riboflavin biosynthesis RibT protein [Weissella uvarum]MCM0595374.1 reductase [Weissella uvarum]